MAKLKLRPDDTNTDANTQRYMMERFLSGKMFTTIVMVKAVYPGEENQMSFVDVRPMVHGTNGAGEMIERGDIFNVPVWRLQAGDRAVIMDPEVGDIGFISCCDEDSRNVKKNQSPSLPASSRNHSYGDAIYMGGLLNQAPLQFAKFHRDGIDIVTPLDVNVNGRVVSVNAEEKISLNAPVIEANGQLIQGAGSRGGNATFGGTIKAEGDITGAGISLSTHTHGGVEFGGSNTQGPQ